MPRRAGLDPTLPFLVTRARAMSGGLTGDQIRQRVRSGRWTRLAPGVYRRNDAELSQAPGDVFASQRRQHAERAVAQALSLTETVIAGHSAAAVHDIPVISRLPDRICLVKASSHGAHRRDADIRSWTLHPSDLLHTHPPVTSLARTWFDVARLGSMSDALCAGDYLLRELLVQQTDFRDVIERAGSSRGIRRACVALDHLSPTRESPLESSSWAYFLRNSVPLPAMQAVVRDSKGGFIGRVDFLWTATRVIGECDGRLKYQSPEDLYAEKRREDQLRAMGYTLVRWGFSDLQSAELALRLRRVLAQAS